MQREYLSFPNPWSMSESDPEDDVLEDEPDDEVDFGDDEDEDEVCIHGFGVDEDCPECDGDMEEDEDDLDDEDDDTEFDDEIDDDDIDGDGLVGI